MTEHLTTTRDAIARGSYDWQRIGSIVLAIVSAIEVLFQMGDAVPVVVRPAIAHAHEWAAMVGVVVATLLAKLGKPVLVRGDA
jgi:hypothetical protein